MHYQDHHNKFSYLYPLSSKCAREVALRLIEIFTLIGSPVILQIDYGREFVAKVIKELKGFLKCNCIGKCKRNCTCLKNTVT